MQGVFQSTLGYNSDKVIINALSTARAEDITISFFIIIIICYMGLFH